MKLKEQKKFGILWLSIGAALFLAGLLLGETGYSSYISGFGGALMGVVSAAMRFGGVNLVNDAWLNNTWSEVLALGAYAILIFYLVKASMKAK